MSSRFPTYLVAAPAAEQSSQLESDAAVQLRLSAAVSASTRELAASAAAYLAAGPEERRVIAQRLVDADVAQRHALKEARDDATDRGLDALAARTIDAEIAAARVLIALDPGGEAAALPSDPAQEPIPEAEQLAALPRDDPHTSEAIGALIGDPAAQGDEAPASPEEVRGSVTLHAVCDEAHQVLEAIGRGVRTDLTAVGNALPDSLPASMEELRSRVDKVIKQSGWLLRRGLERFAAALEWIADRLRLKRISDSLHEARGALADPEGLVPALLGIPAAHQEIQALSTRDIGDRDEAMLAASARLRELATDAGGTFDATADAIRTAVAVAGLASLAPAVGGRVREVVGLFVGCCAAYAVVAGRDYVDAPHAFDRVAGVRATVRDLVGRDPAPAPGTAGPANRRFARTTTVRPTNLTRVLILLALLVLGIATALPIILAFA